MKTPDPMPSEKVLRGTYQLLAKLGSGGMGEVYIAAHTRMSKRFAVKLLAARHGASAEAYARFQREAEITSRLGHPHIVEIIDFDTADDGRPFMVMELLEGEDLADRLARGPLPAGDALKVAEQIGSALQAAHEAGIVHRDLKPQNVFLCQRAGGDFVKILDFGISKIKDHGSVVTQSQVVIGTPGYMSPEQAEGKARSVDARSDQFALAVILYEMVSGVAPFAAESIPATLYRVVHHHPPPLGDVGEGVPTHVSAAVMRAMEKDPAARFVDVATMLAALRGETVSAEGAGAGLSPSSVRKRAVGGADASADTLMHAQTEVSTAGMTQADPRRGWWRWAMVGGVGVGVIVAVVIGFVVFGGGGGGGGGGTGRGSEPATGDRQPATGNGEARTPPPPPPPPPQPQLPPPPQPQPQPQPQRELGHGSGRTRDTRTSNRGSGTRDTAAATTTPMDAGVQREKPQQRDAGEGDFITDF